MKWCHPYWIITLCATFFIRIEQSNLQSDLDLDRYSHDYGQYYFHFRKRIFFFVKSIDIYLNDNEILFYYTKSNHDVELDCNHLVQSIGSWFINWFRNWTNQSFKDRINRKMVLKTGNGNYEGSLQLFNFKGDWIINPITPFSKWWKIWLMKLGASQKGFHFGKIFKPICNREKNNWGEIHRISWNWSSQVFIPIYSTILPYLATRCPSKAWCHFKASYRAKSATVVALPIRNFLHPK